MIVIFVILLKYFSVLERMELNLKGKKCYYLRLEEEYLGKIVGRKSVKVGFIDIMDMWNYLYILKKLKDFVGLLIIIEVLLKIF